MNVRGLNTLQVCTITVPVDSLNSRQQTGSQTFMSVMHKATQQLPQKSPFQKEIHSSNINVPCY